MLCVVRVQRLRFRSSWSESIFSFFITDPEAPPLRPERHVPNSIATLRRRLIAKLVTVLSRCPCCGAKTKGRSRCNL